MKKLIIYSTLAFLFITLNSFSSYSGHRVKVKNRTAANFQLYSLSGTEVTLEDFQGKIVILNFWASWAASCLREMPNLEQLNQKYGPEGIQVLGIAVVSNKEDIQNKANMAGVTYPILYGTKELIASYGSFSDLPTTFIIDEQGKILKQLSGSNDYKTLQQEIIPLLPDPALSKR